VAIWAGSWYFLGFRRARLTRAERHVLALNIGASIAMAVVWLAAGAPYDERLWAIYPAWTVIIGITAFASGSLSSGRLYVLGLLWFGLALVMPRVPEWSPLEFGSFHAVSMSLVGWWLLRRGRKGETANSPPLPPSAS
jgi:hypothetical protein